MNKTIFQIDYKLSIIIVSILGIVIGFVSNAYSVSGIVGLLFHFIKIIILTGLYLVFYLIENKNDSFKTTLKYMFGTIVVLNGFNLIFTIFSSTHILEHLFLTLSGVISLYIIISFVLEILSLYYKNEIADKIILFNKKIGTAVADPIISFFEKKITND